MIDLGTRSADEILEKLAEEQNLCLQNILRFCIPVYHAVEHVVKSMNDAIREELSVGHALRQTYQQIPTPELTVYRVWRKCRGGAGSWTFDLRVLVKRRHERRFAVGPNWRPQHDLPLLLPAYLALVESCTETSACWEVELIENFFKEAEMIQSFLSSLEEASDVVSVYNKRSAEISEREMAADRFIDDG